VGFVAHDGHCSRLVAREGEVPYIFRRVLGAIQNGAGTGGGRGVERDFGVGERSGESLVDKWGEAE
jgi:hypothetical protein